MNLPRVFEKRAMRRKNLTGLLPGRLVVAESGEGLPCKPVDINSKGLGILSEAILAPGCSLILKVKEGDIALQVAWGQPDFGKRDLYRYGILVLDESINLEEVFKKYGCFEKPT